MSTRNDDEIEKFSQRVAGAWERKSCLRAMNDVRVPFITNGLLKTMLEKECKKSMESLENIRILDIGCGVGFLSEALAQTGAVVTGIDASEECIQAAIAHAALDETLKNKLTYLCTTTEDLVGTVEPFDAVVCSEVIEHVNNPQLLVESCSALTKVNGCLFFTTFNKTYSSYLGGIIIPEYIFGYIPRGTHEWNKFIAPADLQNMLKGCGCETQNERGFFYNPLTGNFTEISWTGVWYALHAVKLQ